MPPNLRVLECFENQIKRFDNIPDSLYYLEHTDKDDKQYTNPLEYTFKPTLRNIRKYNAKQAAKKNMKLAVASTSSRQLYSLFGPVPQTLFM